jgi:hypothetical protein
MGEQEMNKRFWHGNLLWLLGKIETVMEGNIEIDLKGRVGWNLFSVSS